MSNSAAPTIAAKAHLFQGFAESSRLLILEALRDGEKTVSEICAITGLGQPNASNHLACLLGCRLVAREQRGRFAHYRLANDGVEALLSLGDEIASGRADAPCCPVCGSEAW
jgi:ArsR family transcriptional regulator, cadmium/lead-responsive transcriptional repressor